MQTTAERMALIREAAQKFKAKQKVLAKFKRDENTSKKKKNASEIDKLDEEQIDRDERHWNDAAKYANEYYGDAFRATTRFDNDWD